MTLAVEFKPWLSGRFRLCQKALKSTCLPTSTVILANVKQLFYVSAHLPFTLLSGMLLYSGGRLPTLVQPAG